MRIVPDENGFDRRSGVAEVDGFRRSIRPDVDGSRGARVRSVLAPEAMVKAPLSAILLVVNVWEPMTVPVMKVPTPALLMRVTPFKVRTPAVMATLPAVAVMFPVVAVNPLVAVMSPEIVGVAVQAVPVTVRLPPREVSPVPSKVKVGLEKVTQSK